MKQGKKVLQRVMALAIVSVVSFALVGCGTRGAKEADAAKTYKIGVIQLVEHPALDAAYKGFKEELAAQGLKEGENVTFNYKNAQNDTNNLNTIATQLASEDNDLILAIATPSAQAIANQTDSIPIVGTAITDYVSASLADSTQTPGRNVTGTSDMNPVADQIALGKELVPTAQTVGLIYNSSEANSIAQIKIAKEALAADGMKAQEVTVTNVNDVQQAVQSLVGKCDFIYIPTDNTLASAMQTVSDITTPAKLPVICGEENLLANGALATKGIDYEELGKKTADMALEILKEGKKPADMPIETADDMNVVINADLVKSFGITVPDAYTKNVVDPATLGQ